MAVTRGARPLCHQDVDRPADGEHHIQDCSDSHALPGSLHESTKGGDPSMSLASTSDAAHDDERGKAALARVIALAAKFATLADPPDTPTTLSTSTTSSRPSTTSASTPTTWRTSPMSWMASAQPARPRPHLRYLTRPVRDPRQKPRPKPPPPTVRRVGHARCPQPTAP